MIPENELLVGLRHGELDALAESMLASSSQSRLDDLLARNSEHALSREEEAELDRLLTRVDQLTLLKARAQYTLKRQGAGAAGT